MMKNSRRGLFVVLMIVVLSTTIHAQNANIEVPAYNGTFNIGVNMGYYGNNWKDEQIADIIAYNQEQQVGLGCNSLRLSLSNELVQKYIQYIVRQPAFEYYGTINCNNNTLFVGEPHEINRETVEHCDGKRSLMFVNMYTPIWDNGENDTPVNDENTFAAYVYRLAINYPNVRFWEIINEPDFTYAAAAHAGPGEPGNWWDDDPPPCSLRNLYAPVQYYVRALRIAYEVIKSVHPDHFVGVGGIGYASFLDAVLRNTDNLDGGKVTSDYPLKGGAYFDCLSYHSYPQYGLRSWNNSKGGFDYFRHSDAAIDVLEDDKDKFQDVLDKYGYNGATYPLKRFIVTETNIPDREFDIYIGSDEAQRNFVMKAAVSSQMMGLDAIYLYTVSDSKKDAEMVSPFESMGVYKNISDQTPYNQVIKSSGIGYKNINHFLQGLYFDKSKTNEMNLPSSVKGGAFNNTDGEYIYVLWARTTQDKNEEVSAFYQFPQSWNFQSVVQYNWDFTESKDSTQYSSEDNVSLYGYPTFFKTNEEPVKTTEGKIVTVTSVVTPNGDGKNDHWEIKELWKMDGAKLYIYDYKGALVHSSEGYDNNWPQQDFNTDTLPNGPYYYTIVFDNMGQKQEGAFRIMR